MYNIYPIIEPCGIPLRTGLLNGLTTLLSDFSYTDMYVIVLSVFIPKFNTWF